MRNGREFSAIQQEGRLVSSHRGMFSATIATLELMSKFRNPDTDLIAESSQIIRGFSGRYMHSAPRVYKRHTQPGDLVDASQGIGVGVSLKYKGDEVRGKMDIYGLRQYRRGCIDPFVVDTSLTNAVNQNPILRLTYYIDSHGIVLATLILGERSTSFYPTLKKPTKGLQFLLGDIQRHSRALIEMG